MNEVELNIAQGRDSALEINKVIRNTYTLLSMTLFFSAICAVTTMVMQVSQGVGFMLFIGGFIIGYNFRKLFYDKDGADKDKERNHMHNINNEVK